MYQSQAAIGITSPEEPALGSVHLALGCTEQDSDWVYTSQANYDREIELIFRGESWNFVALEAEIPNPGTSSEGMWVRLPLSLPGLKITRVAVFEKRCAHRGAEFCRPSQGNTRNLSAPTTNGRSI